MKYVRMWADTPYRGTKEVQYLKVPDDITDEELNEQSDAMSYDNADSFSYLATGWGEGFVGKGFKSEDEKEDYFNDCYPYGGWEFISEEEYLENYD